MRNVFKKITAVLLLSVLISSCAMQRRQPPRPTYYMDCDNLLIDCRAQIDRERKEHRREMTKAFFGTLLVVSFMHWTR
jgi:hypothetical protein